MTNAAEIVLETPDSSIHEDTLLQAVINSIPAPLFFKDGAGRYLGCNKAFEAFVGLAQEDMIGKTVFELWDSELAHVYHEADKALFQEGGKQLYEAQVTYADGSVHDVMFHKAVFHAKQDGISGIAGVMLDITNRKKAERKLERMATTDSLTGIDNRRSFFEILHLAYKRADRRGSDIAVLALDLDGFKDVNDHFGHPLGDKVLIETAKRLKGAIRETDTAARLGGDEFFILLEEIGGQENAKKIAQNLINKIAEPYMIEGKEIKIGVSIGIALVESCSTPEGIISKADKALYQAKNTGKGCFATTA